jgi:DNA-binding response OmpR family regulator
MVVDDEAWLRRAFQRILGEEGYHVIPIDNGRDAVALAVKIQPDIIVLDILMPDMDGMTTLREMRRRGVFSVIVMLTALGTVRSARETMCLGADDYITKPFDINVLKRVLRDGLDSRQQTASDDPCGL